MQLPSTNDSLVFPQTDDNMTWIQNILGKIVNPHSSLEAVNSSTGVTNDSQLRIIEVEMHDDYFGEERYPTMSRIVSVQVKYELLVSL